MSTDWIRPWRYGAPDDMELDSLADRLIHDDDLRRQLKENLPRHWSDPVVKRTAAWKTRVKALAVTMGTDYVGQVEAIVSRVGQYAEARNALLHVDQPESTVDAEREKEIPMPTKSKSKSTKAAPRTDLAKFMETYASGENSKRVHVVDLPAEPTGDSDALDGDGTALSPFIVVRYKGFTMVLNPMPLDDHLCVDAHAFVDGKDATSGVLGMSDGQRFVMESTGTTSHGWSSSGLVALLLGAQGEDTDDA